MNTPGKDGPPKYFAPFDSGHGPSETASSPTPEALKALNGAWQEMLSPLRRSAASIIQNLQAGKVVILSGPHQVGKTTVVGEVLREAEKDMAVSYTPPLLNVGATTTDQYLRAGFQSIKTHIPREGKIKLTRASDVERDAATEEAQKKLSIVIIDEPVGMFALSGLVLRPGNDKGARLVMEGLADWMKQLPGKRGMLLVNAGSTANLRNQIKDSLVAMLSEKGVEVVVQDIEPIHIPEAAVQNYLQLWGASSDLVAFFNDNPPARTLGILGIFDRENRRRIEALEAPMRSVEDLKAWIEQPRVLYGQLLARKMGGSRNAMLSMLVNLGIEIVQDPEYFVREVLNDHDLSRKLGFEAPMVDYS